MAVFPQLDHNNEIYFLLTKKSNNHNRKLEKEEKGEEKKIRKARVKEVLLWKNRMSSPPLKRNK